MFRRKPKKITAFDVTNYLYPVGQPEVDPILTDRDISDFSNFRLNQARMWENDKYAKKG